MDDSKGLGEWLDALEWGDNDEVRSEVGPLDVDPNQKVENIDDKGNLPSLFPMTLKEFYAIRSDFVVKLLAWSGGLPSQTTAEMAEVLEYMADDFDHFKALATDKTGACFPIKCDLIKKELLGVIKQIRDSPEISLETEEIMDYLGRAIGRLTTKGLDYFEPDAEAVEMEARMAKIHSQNVWDMQDMGWGEEVEQLRKTLWTSYVNLNFSMSGCGCFQCKRVWPDEIELRRAE
ncbi:uncharacterized protein N7482_003888 [Penicillium canariense]|uniref:Uncharacterized protein n=1 Tax=Penicillium canariense TaxID=189055 RepID=A0A9W9LNV6_9EURO|nr:uncharacterized protein N7482_003888 [Penicillium canariense]KAJ5168294.1 hypothetical protein N7482_003888 [Penicillium canariense]